MKQHSFSLPLSTPSLRGLWIAFHTLHRFKHQSRLICKISPIRGNALLNDFFVTVFFFGPAKTRLFPVKCDPCEHEQVILRSVGHFWRARLIRFNRNEWKHFIMTDLFRKKVHLSIIERLAFACGECFRDCIRSRTINRYASLAHTNSKVRQIRLLNDYSPSKENRSFASRSFSGKWLITVSSPLLKWLICAGKYDTIVDI